MEEKVKVLILKPGLMPYEMIIENTPEAKQKITGEGWFGTIFCFEHEDMYLLVNDEGKKRGLYPNRAILDENGNVVDYIAGTVICTAIDADDEEGNDRSLTEDEIEECLEKFEKPEIFLRDDTGIYATKTDVEFYADDIYDI